jgi:hypothetical protein
MDLLNRYLTSVKKALPVDKQTDIIRELKANILDEVEALEQSDRALKNAQAIQLILEKYGHPTATAQRFAPQSPLVAGEDIPLYKSVLLHGAALIFVFSIIQTLSSMLLSDSINPLRLIFQTIGNFLEHSGLMLLAVTLSFYYLGKNGILSKWRYKDWSLAKLPMFPEAKVSLSDTFTDITTTCFLLLLLWTPLWMSEDGLQSLLFSLAPQSEYWRIILTLASVASLLFGLYRLTQVNWQRWSLIAYIGDHLVFAVIFIWMATETKILLVSHSEVADSWPIVQELIDNNFQYTLAAAGLVIAVIGMFQAYKARKLFTE